MRRDRAAKDAREGTGAAFPHGIADGGSVAHDDGAGAHERWAWEAGGDDGTGERIKDEPGRITLLGHC